MQTYYHSLTAIEQQTMQLDHVQCAHCQRKHQLVSHGFIYKKRTGGQPKAVGKRVYCSNRRRHAGCGRTMQLYAPNGGVGCTVGGIDPSTLHQTTHAVSAQYLSRMY